MEYYIAKGKRRREERAAASTAETYRPRSFQLTETKSLEASTASNTLITTTSYDDSDDELGEFVYRTSLTAKKIHEEEQIQAKVSSTQSTTRRKSSRLELEGNKSKEVEEKESIYRKPTSTDNNNKKTKRISSSNKGKAVVLSADDEVCTEVTSNIKRVFRSGQYRTLCSSAGCTNIALKDLVCKRHGAVVKTYTCKHKGCTSKAQKGGVCIRHGAKVAARKICSHEGCSNNAQKGGVCVKHGAKRNNNKRKICSHTGCTKIAQKGGVCTKHGAEVKTCRHKGCSSLARREGVCFRHGAKVKTCSHKGCNNHALKGGVCIKHGAVVKRAMCTAEGCTKWAVKERL